MSNISKDGRFKISRLHTDSDDWYGLEWAVIDIREGKQIHQLYGNIKETGATQVVEFSPDGKEVIGKDGEGDIVERFKLPTGSSTPVIDAVEAGNIEKTRTLIEGGADVNTRDTYRRTALMVAAEKGRIDITKLLLEKGADVNAKSKYGETALMNSAKSETVIVKSIAKGQFYIAKLLLENGADVNLKSKQGETALMRSARNGHFDTVELLLKKGAKVNAKSKSGMTAPMAAIRGKVVVRAGGIAQHDKVIKLLERAKEPTLLEKLKLMKLQEKARGKEEDRNE